MVMIRVPAMHIKAGAASFISLSASYQSDHSDDKPSASWKPAMSAGEPLKERRKSSNTAWKTSNYYGP